MSRAGSPAYRAKRAGGWRHIAAVLHERRGTVLEDGERVVAGLTLPDHERDHQERGVLHVRCSRCQRRLRAGSYVLPVGVSVLCERCSEAPRDRTVHTAVTPRRTKNAE